jgi:RNA polymerase sigma factor (sigma-70 family)
MQDHELLREFAQRASQEAFAELVGRYSSAVYSAARRQLGDVQLAEDVTQAVFIILAQKAGKLAKSASLASWLIKTTYFACRDARKTEARRRRHEQAAALLAQRREQSMAANTSTRQTQQISDELDQALAALRDRDRGAITLRYLQGMTMMETADALGISESAAAKRITRALDALRRRVIAPAAALAAILDGLPRFAPSPALAQSAAAAATAAGPAGISIAKGTIHMMQWMKIKAAVLVIGISAAAATAGAGVLTLLQEAPASPPPAAPAAAPAPAPLAAPAVDELGGTRAALSNGVWIEIVGIGQHGEAGPAWWLPDGTALARAPYAYIAAHIYSPKGLARHFAVRIGDKIPGTADRADVIWSVTNATASAGADPADPIVPDLQAREVAVADDPEGVTLHAQVAAGKWKTQFSNAGWGSGSQSTAGGTGGTSYALTTFESGGRTHLVYAVSGLGNMDVRGIAIDQSGIVHQVQPINGSSADQSMAGECAVDLPMSQIKRWELQTRPYDQWIEIRHIALHADQGTDVQIVTSDDAAGKP